MTIANQILFDGEVANALTADRYTQWCSTHGLSAIGFAIHTPGTGSPVGAFSFEGSNDHRVIERERAGGIAPASTTAKKFAIATGLVVQGSALAITGSTPSNTYVAFSGGLPEYIRVKFASASGGSAASLPSIFTSGH